MWGEGSESFSFVHLLEMDDTSFWEPHWSILYYLVNVFLLDFECLSNLVWSMCIDALETLSMLSFGIAWYMMHSWQPLKFSWNQCALVWLAYMCDSLVGVNNQCSCLVMSANWVVPCGVWFTAFLCIIPIESERNISCLVYIDISS